MEQFFIFGSEGYLTTFAVTPVLFDYAIENDLHGWESGREIHHQLLYGDYETKEYPDYIQFPVDFIQFDGKRMRDVLDMRYDGHCVLISDRMRDVMQDAEITGWRTYPIRLYDKKKNEVTGYNGFTVTGRGGELTLVNSQTKLRGYWNYAQWDGSDFFWVKPNCIIVTERVRTCFKQHKIESLHYWNLSEHYLILNAAQQK